MLKKKGLTDLEIIERIEQAPAEMQARVAKAFIREDIDNDDVQYLFNEDPMEVLNETGTNENIDAEEPDGIACGQCVRQSQGQAIRIILLQVLADGILVLKDIQQMVNVMY